jgi:excisionase family DNA binding protein
MFAFVNDTRRAMTNGNSKFLSGCKEIADYIGETERRTFDLLSDRKIPAFKEGKLWRANKESLDRHYEELEQNTFRSIGAAQAVVNSIKCRNE